MNEAIWQQLEQGDYAADVNRYWPYAAAADTTLELGAGCGRVTLPLAAITDLTAVDLDAELLGELRRRADDLDLSVTCVIEDALDLDLKRQFDLVLAPVSFVQIVGERDQRLALLHAIVRHMAPNGLAVVETLDVDELMEQGDAHTRRHHEGRRTYASRQLAPEPLDEDNDLVELMWTREVYTRLRAVARRRRSRWGFAKPRRAGQSFAKRTTLPPQISTYARVEPAAFEEECADTGLRIERVIEDKADGYISGRYYLLRLA